MKHEILAALAEVERRHAVRVLLSRAQPIVAGIDGCPGGWLGGGLQEPTTPTAMLMLKIVMRSFATKSAFCA